MISFISIIIAALAGKTYAYRCKTHYTLGTAYYTYCSGGCCYDTYSDPCCYSDIYIYEGVLSIGAIVGIVIGVISLIAIVVSVIVCCVCASRRRQASAGQVITSNQPSVAFVTQTQSAIAQGLAQHGQYGHAYANSGFSQGTAAQPPVYNQVTGQAYLPQLKTY